MELRFAKHYTPEEANALLPHLRGWLHRLRELRPLAEHVSAQIAPRVEQGWDVGGESVNRSLRLLEEMRRLAGELQTREIQIKDLERGLVDFPALIGGREVFLCWREDEDAVEFWHELDAGFAGRHRV